MDYLCFGESSIPSCLTRIIPCACVYTMCHMGIKTQRTPSIYHLPVETLKHQTLVLLQRPFPVLSWFDP